MKKLFALLLVAVFLVGCNNSKLDLGPVALGDSLEETLNKLTNSDISFEEKEDGLISIEDSELLGVKFKVIVLEFKNDKLCTVLGTKFLSSPLSNYNLSDEEFKELKIKMEDIFGKGKLSCDDDGTDYVLFGKESEDKYCGGWLFDYENNTFHLAIKTNLGN